MVILANIAGAETQSRITGFGRRFCTQEEESGVVRGT
jgi:hypothetical protein